MPGALLRRLPHQALRGAPGGVPLCSSACQASGGPASHCSATDAGVWGDRGYSDGSTPTVTRRCHLAPVAAWLSSTGVSHHDLLPHIPSTHRSAVSSIAHPGVAPQSPKSSSQPLRLPGDQPSCPGYVRLQQGLFNSHSIQSATDRLFHAQP